MKPRLLLPDQAATIGGEKPSQELVEIIQRLVIAVRELQEFRDGVASVAEPTGGGTVDAEARAAINAIRGL